MLAPHVIERIGLRAGVTTGAAMCCFSAVLRSLTAESPWAELLAHIAQLVNGMAGVFVLATPSKLSALWFEPSLRTTTTATVVMANYLGAGVGFLVALAVDTPDKVRTMLYAEAGVAAGILIIAVGDHYFPGETCPALATTGGDSHYLLLWLLVFVQRSLRCPRACHRPSASASRAAGRSCG